MNIWYIFRMKMVVTVVGVFVAFIFSCTTTGQEADNRIVSMDQAIRETVYHLENTMEHGTIVALVNFTSPSVAFSNYVLDELQDRLVNGGKLLVVDRTELDLRRRERQFHLSGEVSDETAVRIGQEVGAQVIVTGSLTSMGQTYRIRIRSLIVETGHIAASRSTDINSREERVRVLLAGSTPIAETPPQTVPRPAQTQPVQLPSPTQVTQPIRRMRHNNIVNSVSFSPNGRQIISGSHDNTAKLWDASTGREIRTFSGHTDFVLSVAFNHDGSQIVTGSYDNTVKLWDVATGRELRTFSGHTVGVSSVTFSPNGRQIFSGSYDSTIKSWDVTTGSLIRTFSGHTRSINDIAISPNGSQIISGSDDNTVKLWDVTTGRETRTFLGQNGIALSVAFSPDGRQIIAGFSGIEGRNGLIKLWDVATGRELMTFSGHPSNVRAVSFSPDGRQIASASWDGPIRLFDVTTGRMLNTFSGHDKSSNSVSFSPDGRLIVSSAGGGWPVTDTTIRLWNVSTGNEITVP